MEVEYEQENIPLRILELFNFYLSDQEIKSVIASCPKSDWTLAGWLPVDTLLSFKKVKAISTNKEEILSILSTQASDLIEFTQDFQYMRRRNAFSPSIIPQKRQIDCCLEVSGFSHSISPIEIQTIFSKYGAVENVTFGEKSGTYIVDFYELNSITNALLTPIVYEDQKISVRTIRKPGVEIVKSKIPKSYTVNRMIQFGPVEENVQKQFIKQAFEQYANVTMVDFDHGNKFGYLRFKKGVAKEMVDIVYRNGGIIIRGMEDKLEFHPLEGDEEAVYWQLDKIKKEKNLYSQERTFNTNLLLKKSKRLTKKEKLRLKKENLRQKQNKGSSLISKNDKSKIKSSLLTNKKFLSLRSENSHGGQVKENLKKRVKIDPIEELFRSLTVKKEDEDKAMNQ